MWVGCRARCTAEAEGKMKAKQNDLGDRVAAVVREAELQHGHAFSGGTGLSWFLRIRAGSNEYREYGNGVDLDGLRGLLVARVPEFRSLDGFMD